MITLRPYQKEAVSKMIWARKLAGNDIVVIPSAGGKSLIISDFAEQSNEPILILVPTKELLEQDKEKLEHWTHVNVYSAGMNEKTIGNITLATIQSVYKKPELFSHFKVVIVDECDLISPKKLNGMYNKFFRGMGSPKVYGLTATPFRMDSYYKEPPGGWGAWQMRRWKNYKDLEVVTTIKMINRYKEKFWDRMLFTVDLKDLVAQGYLTPLTYHDAVYVPQDKLSFNKSKSDFDFDDFEQNFNPFLEQTSRLIKEIESKSVLVFCVTITQARNLQALLPGSVVVTADTPKKERDFEVKRFRTGEVRTVINVGVLLVGFDKPDLETIIVARPTRSLRLHAQLLGRGMRISNGKTTCHVYDLVGNIKILGEVESMKIERIDGMWNVTTSKGPFHMRELYTHQIRG